MYKLSAIRNTEGDAGIEFDLEVKGSPRHFTVSSDAIKDLTRSTGALLGKDLRDAFREVSGRVAEVAQRRCGTSSNTRVLLTHEDF